MAAKAARRRRTLSIPVLPRPEKLRELYVTPESPGRFSFARQRPKELQGGLLSSRTQGGTLPLP